MADSILSVDDLCVEFHTRDGVVRAVDGISFTVQPGETLGIVGESGSGKSVSVMSVLGLIPRPPGRIPRGRAVFGGRDLLALSPQQLRSVRGREVAMVFQDPMTSLNPVFRIGDQIAEAIEVHEPNRPRRDVRNRAVELMELVGLPARRYRDYPHQFSGGMRQRAMIALAVANSPSLLIADEPTTALDVTIQRQILEVIKRARGETAAATILITHDLGLVAEMADRVAVMYAGRIVELGSVDTIFHHPRHPYTVGLMESRPRLEVAQDALAPIPGQPPSLIRVPPGCAFHPRCYLSAGRERCRTEEPTLRTPEWQRHHLAACHFAEELAGDPTLPAPVSAAAGSVAVGEPAAADTETAPPRIPTPPAASSPATAPPTDPVAVPAAVPDSDGDPDADAVLRIRGLVKHFPVRAGLLRRQVGVVHAVDGVDLSLRPGETLGIVGESGCGKSTLARTIMRLVEPTAGRITFADTDITRLGGRGLRAARRHVRMVFQDPYASLNPRMTVAEVVGEPLWLQRQAGAAASSRAGRAAKVRELLEIVGLSPEHAGRYPHEFSGGQRQRIGIARALALDPRILILDEPVSALDVSIQAQILNLLTDIQDRFGLAYVFISHDLSVVRHLSDRVAVMYVGKVVETGTREDIFGRPAHPYTQALLSSAPISDPAERGRGTTIVLSGDVPNPVSPPSGCRFRTRCWKAQDICKTEEPALVDRGQGHPSACHFAETSPVLTDRVG